MPRQAFLYGDGKSVHAGNLTDVSAKSEGREAARLIDQAGREIAEQVANNVLIHRGRDADREGHRIACPVDRAIRWTESPAPIAEAMSAVKKSSRDWNPRRHPGSPTGKLRLDAVNEMINILLGSGDLHNRPLRKRVDRAKRPEPAS